MKPVTEENEVFFESSRRPFKGRWDRLINKLYVKGGFGFINGDSVKIDGAFVGRIESIIHHKTHSEITVRPNTS